MDKKKATPTTSATYSLNGDMLCHADILLQLINACRTPPQKSLLRDVWHKQGVLTHELIPATYANNLHAMSQRINNRIRPLGWQIVKKDLNGSTASSAWYLTPMETNQQQEG